MKVGFTGTQVGMTTKQKVAVETLIKLFGEDIEEAHHGDCIGADAEFHCLAIQTNAWVVIHPPIIQTKRAHMKADEERIPLDYLVRNKAIVNSSTVMIATPKGPEVGRSGTLSNIRYAKQLKKPLYIVYPDGWLECFYTVDLPVWLNQ